MENLTLVLSTTVIQIHLGCSTLAFLECELEDSLTLMDTIQGSADSEALQASKSTWTGEIYYLDYRVEHTGGFELYLRSEPTSTLL